jgi:hypothetical protein
MFDTDDDIFTNNETGSDGFKEAQDDLESLSEEDFMLRYKAVKRHYKAILNAMRELQIANEVLSEMGALAIDPEIGDNTQLLIEDYTRLLDQMHMASYWEREG